MSAERSRAAEKILSLAEEGLRKWEEGFATLDGYIDSMKSVPSGERAAASSLLFEYFRHKGLLDGLVASHASKGSVKAGLRRIVALSAAQALFQTGIAPQSAVNVAVDFTRAGHGRGAGGFVNAMLRAILSCEKVKAGTFPADFPDALLKRWEAAYGAEKAKSMVAASASNPPLSFRLRGRIEDTELAAAECRKAADLDWAGGFQFYECLSPEKFFKSGWLERGLVYVQDAATALSISLAGSRLDGGLILDLCSAPGGKALMMKDSFPGAGIVAADRSSKRLLSAVSNFMRAGLDIPSVAAEALTPPFREGAFSLVFADVPCSNTGVARRRPDAPWRFSERKLAKIVSLQRRILDSASGLVAPGGALLYSTCSVEPEENSLQVEEFLTRRPEFALESERLVLPCERHDGAFAALLSKRA